MEKEEDQVERRLPELERKKMKELAQWKLCVEGNGSMKGATMGF